MSASNRQLLGAAHRPADVALARSMIRTRTALVLLAGGALSASSAWAADSASPAISGDPVQACAVWERELGFAASVAAHDRAAFATHVDADAVFAPDSPSPQRGREAVVDAWEGLIRGDQVRLRWYPERVAVSGDLAWSTGPALFEPLGRPGPPRTTRFRSVWRRGVDGVWRVLFDDGDRPQPASAEAVTAFETGRMPACPGPDMNAGEVPAH
jgi:ketosteroid isomerase-like protein